MKKLAVIQARNSAIYTTTHDPIQSSYAAYSTKFNLPYSQLDFSREEISSQRSGPPGGGGGGGGDRNRSTNRALCFRDSSVMRTEEHNNTSSDNIKPSSLFPHKPSQFPA
uniref:Uncharacterized protein n=1 Tax=Opuntia streptacantha TaxID=393608 RepID=A0A7C8ZG81_OPUST